jgi:hypothetical protein
MNPNAMIPIGLADTQGRAIALGSQVNVAIPGTSPQPGLHYDAAVEGADQDDVGPYLVLRTRRGERRYTRPEWVTVVEPRWPTPELASLA